MRVITARFHEYPALENTPETERSVKSRAGQGNAFIKVVTNTTSHRCRCPKRSRHFEIITRPSSSYKPRGAITFVREIARIKRACFVNEKRFCEWEVARVSASGKPSFYRPRGTNVASKMFLFTVRERETERERESEIDFIRLQKRYRSCSSSSSVPCSFLRGKKTTLASTKLFQTIASARCL